MNFNCKNRFIHCFVSLGGSQPPLFHGSSRCGLHEVDDPGGYDCWFVATPLWMGRDAGLQVSAFGKEVARNANE